MASIEGRLQAKEDSRGRQPSFGHVCLSWHACVLVCLIQPAQKRLRLSRFLRSWLLLGCARRQLLPWGESFEKRRSLLASTAGRLKATGQWPLTVGCFRGGPSLSCMAVQGAGSSLSFDLVCLRSHVSVLLCLMQPARKRLCHSLCLCGSWKSRSPCSAEPAGSCCRVKVSRRRESLSSWA